ncbi:hypothetical protein A9Q83_11910 [Alphaproteobacteria bacterium 46_93_T64]|nr:hypothetical protein A9Q83_11910 [Alphaproteobacteria bacterium 46_93_T64]
MSKISCTFMVIFVLSSLTTKEVQAENSLTSKQIGEFVTTLFSGKGPEFGRWVKPIKYRTFGLETEISVEMFDSGMKYFSEMSGVEVIKEETGPANYFVILVDNYKTAANSPDVQKLFKDETETLEEFKGRFLRAENNTEKTHGIYQAVFG